MDIPQLRRPEHLPDYSEMCLQALVEHGLAEKISLGGALGLLHYLDYWATHDVAAWWAEMATQADQRQVLQVLEVALSRAGEVKTRAWGDVVSVELMRAGKAVFSFQIARRSAQLEPSQPAPWIQVPQAAGSSTDFARARLAVETHLARIAQHRRLEQIADAGQRLEAEQVRAWFHGGFLDAAG